MTFKTSLVFALESADMITHNSTTMSFAIQSDGSGKLFEDDFDYSIDFINQEIEINESGTVKFTGNDGYGHDTFCVDLHVTRPLIELDIITARLKK